MGFFNKVWHGVKRAAKAVVDTVVDIAINPSKVWNGITGRTKFEEAEALLQEIEDRYDKAKRKYEEDIAIIALKIEEKISKINYHKRDIYDNHFVRFVSLGNKIHNISVKGNNFLEYFDASITEVKNLSGVRGKNDLYQIDFNNLKFTEIALGIVTLGFFTRKKATQTLLKVQEEEKRIDEEIEKMQAQTVKANVILESIGNVDEYFAVLVQNYTKLLDRFEYGIKSQVQKNILKGILLVDGKLNFKMMPIAHIEEFQALFNLSIVLKQMASLGYLNEDGEMNNEDIKSVENIQKIISSNQPVAA
jgi:hypothetical protein